MSTAKFRAPKWLRDPHLQTIYPHLFRTKRMPPWHMERIECPDGDFFDIHSHILADKPIVILIHGLEGSSRSSYIIRSALALLQAGFGVVALNMRSCSGVLNRSVSFYHSGYTQDLAFLVQLLKHRHGRPIGAIGFSLGGNMLLRLAGEQGISCALDAIMAVSAPIDLSSSTQKLNSWQGRLYEKRFLRMLKQKIKAKQSRLRAAQLDVDTILKTSTLREFDRHLTAPTFGFQNEEDYYQKSSALTVLGRLRIPTLLVQSKDDPMLSDRCYPDSKDYQPWFEALYTEQGGHVGFVYGHPMRPRFFIEDQACSFFSRVLK